MKLSLARLAALVMIVIVAGLAILSWWSPRETPSSLGGVAIGSQRDGWSRISFRRIACTALPNVAPDPDGVRVDGLRCTTPVAGQPLVIEIERFDPARRMAVRRCSAQYGTRTVDCEGGHMTSTGPTYAMVPAAPLGIDGATLAAIRRSSLLEKIGSDFWLGLSEVLAAALALCLGIALAMGIARTLWLRATIATGTAVASYFIVWIGVLRLLGNFVD